MADRDKQKERMWESNRLSEDEKKMRNPLYKKARESYMRMVLPAMGAWIPFVIVLMYLLDTAENKMLMGIFAILLVPLLPVAIGVLGDRSLKRWWICPHCRSPLPEERTQYISMPKYTASCPSCGYVLEEKAEQVREKNQNLFQEKRRKWPAVLLGILTVCHGIFWILMAAVSLEEEPLAGAEWGIALNIAVILAGLFLIFAPTHRNPAEIRPVLAVREGKRTLLGGCVAWLCSLCLLLIAAVIAITEPVGGIFFAVALMGLTGLFEGVWLITAWRNRGIYLFSDHSTAWVTGLGRMRIFNGEELSSVCLGATGRMQVMDDSGRKLFSYSRSMVGAGELTDWMKESGVAVRFSKMGERMMTPRDEWMEQKEQKESQSGEEREKEEQASGFWQGHEKGIRIGMVLVTVGSLAGGILPFFFLSELKIRTAVLIMSLSPLLMVLYYLIFAPVISMRGKKRGEKTGDDRIHMPAGILSLLCVWVVTVTGGMEKVGIAVVDEGRELIFWGILAAVLVAALILRTPKKRRCENLYILCAALVLLGNSLTYSLNLALASDTWHIPAKVVDRSVSKDEEDPDYYLTVRLEDGKEVKLCVSETLYRMDKRGEKLVVCQRVSPFGIRMANIHLPRKEV